MTQAPQAGGEYRAYLFPPGHPRIESLRGLDAYEYAPRARHDEFTGGLIDGWRRLYKQPFVGVTSDGTLREGLYDGDLDVPEADRAPVAAMVAAATELLDITTDDERTRLCHDVDAVEWQTWANPEFLQFDTGLRLEFTRPAVVEAFLRLVQASTSPRGYELIRTAMRINGFLGDVVGLPGIMNELSYNVALYGEPHPTNPGAGSCTGTTARSTVSSSTARWSSPPSSSAPSRTRSTRARTPARSPSPSASRSAGRSWRS